MEGMGHIGAGLGMRMESCSLSGGAGCEGSKTSCGAPVGTGRALGAPLAAEALLAREVGWTKAWWSKDAAYSGQV